MEVIIANVLFKAFVKGKQNKCCNTKKKKTGISVTASFFCLENRHNDPGTPVERLSLNTTVIFDD